MNTLGSLIRRLRLRNRWTLRQMAERVGIPFSTLSKVEGDKLTLTYDKLKQFSTGLGMSLTEFLSELEAPEAGSPPVVTARMSFAPNGRSAQILAPSFDYEYLCADLRAKRMTPVIVRIPARDIAESGAPFRRAGEEFVFVLEGTIEVHMQFYASVTLTMGQWIYLDSTMQHAYVAKSCESAVMLAVCCGEDR
jgi:transcriptional regulator with XRE-family HTH domain